MIWPEPWKMLTEVIFLCDGAPESTLSEEELLHNKHSWQQSAFKMAYHTIN